MTRYPYDGAARAESERPIRATTRDASNQWSYADREDRTGEREDALADLLTSPDGDARAAIDTLLRGLVDTLGLDRVEVSLNDAAHDFRVDVARDTARATHAAATFRFEFHAGPTPGAFIASASRAGFPEALERLALGVAARKAAHCVEDWLRERQSPLLIEKALFHRQLRLMFDLVPMMVWSSLPDGSCEYLNRAHTVYTGMSAAQSRHFGWQNAIHPQDLGRRMDQWRYSLATGLPSDAEVRIRRRDGVYRWFLLRVEPFRDESGAIVRWYGAATDIEDRKLAEDGVRRGEALLAEVQRLAGLGIFSWRVGSDRMAWSEPLYRMFGIDTDTPITRAALEPRTHPGDCVFMFDTARRDVERGDIEDDMRLVMQDGSIRYLHYCAYVTTALTGETEYVGTVQDITERRRASEALAQARAELAQAARASSLGILTASIAHEVNQPLAGIVTNANVCLRMLGSDPPNIAGAIATAQRTVRDGKRAAAVISRLRTLFNQEKINASWWDFGEATREVIDLVQGDVRRHRITLVPLLDSVLQPIEGDRIQLQQVMMNLVRNAIDAINMTSDGPRVIVIELSECGGGACLSVRDSGVGYDDKAVGELFEPFYTTKTQGMGIGLSVSRSIIKAHGGQLWAKKNLRRGATFGFSIPFGRNAQGDPDPEGESRAP